MKQPVTTVIRERFSCRIYQDRPIEQYQQVQLQAFLETHQIGPLGSTTRLSLIAATEHDRQSLKGLGTYGFIKAANGFIIGAMGPGPKNLEDFGYLMELAILFAADIGLGTCWLGGSFTKSSFSRKMALTADETVPAVTSVGYIAENSKTSDWIRKRAGSAARLPAEKLFFDEEFGQSLNMDKLGVYAEILEMVRWAPSASNKQPWRIVRHDGAWHFYLQRTKGYGNRSLAGKLLRVADLQRVDLGIAMCHFQLTAEELGLKGSWVRAETDISKPDELTEYTVTWQPEE